MSENVYLKSPPNESGSRAIPLLPKEDWLVVGWVLAIKVLIFVFGAKSYQVLEDEPLQSARSWLEIWNRWDSIHYQGIAEFGYQAGDVSIAFYPLFPWCVRLISYLNKDYLASAFIVSGVASVAAVVLMRRIVQLDFSAHIARRAVWFFLVFPTAYFLHIGYTESLFLALALGSVLAARTGRWWLAGFIGALAWMTRANGIVLVPTLAIEALHQCIQTKRWQWRWLWIGLIPAGFGVYLLINWRVSGDAFAFVRTREEFFYISLSGPWVGIREAIGNLHRYPNEAEMVGAQELSFSALGLVCAIFSWIKLRPLYAMWMTSSWLLFASVTFLQSVPRYALSMFPIFFLFALLAKNRFWSAVITVWSLLFLALFSSLFVRGWWAF
jgi:hypothetical protein